MSVIDSVKFLIYRVHEKGLEVFLLKNEENWEMPEGWLDEKELESQELIELEETKEHSGSTKKTYAIEGDWHDIPSIRKMIKKDVNYLKNKIKSILPDQSNGHFVSIKDAAKNVLPGDDGVIKELKEIISEKNLTKYI